MWHAQALESSARYLPSDCPLVSHVITNYQKHHSLALTIIPEDEELCETVKVIRPLNEVKNDNINYHHIVRDHVVPEARCIDSESEKSCYEAVDQSPEIAKLSVDVDPSAKPFKISLSSKSVSPRESKPEKQQTSEAPVTALKPNFGSLQNSKSSSHLKIPTFSTN